MKIRTEESDDEAAIGDVVHAAFAPMAFSRQTEGAIVRSLRQGGGLTVSLVAEDQGEIVGHIAFSPITIDGEDLGWFSLGPVSVLPDRQKEGIGSKLVRSGLDRLRDKGAKGCVVFGDPAYYERFGFGANGRLTYETAPAEYFLSQSFGGDTPKGAVSYHRHFEAGHRD